MSLVSISRSRSAEGGGSSYVIPDGEVYDQHINADANINPEKINLSQSTLVSGAACELLVIGGIIDTEVMSSGEGFSWIPDGEQQMPENSVGTHPPQEGAGTLYFEPQFKVSPAVVITPQGKGLHVLDDFDQQVIPIGIVEEDKTFPSECTIVMFDGGELVQPEHCTFSFLAFGLRA